MTSATLSRGGTSVTFDIYRAGGELLVASDVGKPNLQIQPVTRGDPRSADHKSGRDQITVLGVFEGPGAYSRADALVEDLVKPHSGGDALQLDITNVPGYDSILEVGVPSEQAVRIDYRPGVRNRVDCQLSLPVVSSTVG